LIPRAGLFPWPVVHGIGELVCAAREIATSISTPIIPGIFLSSISKNSDLASLRTVNWHQQETVTWRGIFFSIG
jgi:hypothetical protein